MKERNKKDNHNKNNYVWGIKWLARSNAITVKHEEIQQRNTMKNIKHTSTKKNIK